MRSATARTPRRRRCTGCSLPSSGSSRPCSTSPSEVTTRRWPWRTARRSGRFSQPRTRRASLPAFAALLRQVMARVGAVHRILADAARSDQDAASLLTEIARQRHEGQQGIARSLARSGALRPGLRETRCRRHHPRPGVPRGVRLARHRPGLDPRALRKLAEVDPLSTSFSRKRLERLAGSGVRPPLAETACRPDVGGDGLSCLAWSSSALVH